MEHVILNIARDLPNMIGKKQALKNLKEILEKDTALLEDNEKAEIKIIVKRLETSKRG